MRRPVTLVAALLQAGVMLALAAMPAAANSGMVRGPMSVAPAYELAQGRACRACRADCYARYRTYCGYSESCRRSFTLCMRDCWEGYCR